MNTKRAVLYTILALVAIAVLSMDARAQSAPCTTDVECEALPKVNVNTATEAQLQFLPGIGPSLASRINDYKEACCDHAEGPKAAFASVDDLLKVKGIKAARLARIRPYVALTGATTATAKIRTQKEGVK